MTRASCMSLLGFLYFFYVSSFSPFKFYGGMVGAFFWGIFAVFSPYCPSAGFYNLWGQPTSNFKRLCDFERDGERERGRDGWMVFGCLRGEGGLRRILLDGATVNSATIDGMRVILYYFLTFNIIFRIKLTYMYTFYHLHHLRIYGINGSWWNELMYPSRSELDVVGTSC